MIRPAFFLSKPQSQRLSLFLLSACLFLGAVFFSFTGGQRVPLGVAVAAKVQLLQDLEQLRVQSERLVEALTLAQQGHGSMKNPQGVFYQTKKAYKSTEYLLEYLDPEMTKNLNGAPLPKVVVEQADYLTLGLQEPRHVVYPAEGLQVLEELLFAEEPEAEAIGEALALAHRLRERAALFRQTLQHQPLTDKQVLESLREQVLRVMTMGITGFDAPAAGEELALAAASLEPVLAVVQGYGEATTGKAQTQAEASADRLRQAIRCLRQHPDFAKFDRIHFIRELADPAYGYLTALQHTLLPPASPSLTKAVNDRATGLFSPDFLQAAYYAKQDGQSPREELVSLGQALFFDPLLSRNNERSCASCHAPAKAFTDGQARSVAFNFQGTVQRNAPTLLNAVYSKAYFWDSRVAYLQDQIPGVLTKADELHGSYEEVVQKLGQSKAYKQWFRKAFAGEGRGKTQTISANTINRALAAYLQSLVALNAPFDLYMRHETEQLPEAAKRGFNLFMGKAGCGTCHFVPVFNGTVPPRFAETEVEVLGVPATADLSHPTLDKDLGRGGVIAATPWERAFKTPTVRNAALTGPYMHNGAFGTLEEVMEFYNRGGGAGLGLDVPNQTLPSDPLNLSLEEISDVVAFMHTLTDTTGHTAQPASLPAFGKKSGLQERLVGGRY